MRDLLLQGKIFCGDLGGDGKSLITDWAPAS